MLTEEKINANYTGYVSKLKKYGCYTEKLEKDVEFNKLLSKATYATVQESGCAYEGSLVEMITRIAVIAFNINNQLHEPIRVPVESLIKVCYLHQIAKALMITKNETEWETKKGKLFTFTKNLPALKTGEYSIFICNEYGIKLTEEEFEAILAIDKSDDVQVKYYGNLISQILKSSIELACSEKKLLSKIKE